MWSVIKKPIYLLPIVHGGRLLSKDSFSGLETGYEDIVNSWGLFNYVYEWFNSGWNIHNDTRVIP